MIEPSRLFIRICDPKSIWSTLEAEIQPSIPLTNFTSPGTAYHEILRDAKVDVTFEPWSAGESYMPGTALYVHIVDVDGIESSEAMDRCKKDSDAMRRVTDSGGAEFAVLLVSSLLLKFRSQKGSTNAKDKNPMLKGIISVFHKSPDQEMEQRQKKLETLLKPVMNVVRYTTANDTLSMVKTCIFSYLQKELTDSTTKAEEALNSLNLKVFLLQNERAANAFLQGSLRNHAFALYNKVWSTLRESDVTMKYSPRVPSALKLNGNMFNPLQTQRNVIDTNPSLYDLVTHVFACQAHMMVPRQEALDLFRTYSEWVHQLFTEEGRYDTARMLAHDGCMLESILSFAENDPALMVTDTQPADRSSNSFSIPRGHYGGGYEDLEVVSLTSHPEQIRSNFIPTPVDSVADRMGRLYLALMEKLKEIEPYLSQVSSVNYPYVWLASSQGIFSRAKDVASNALLCLGKCNRRREILLVTLQQIEWMIRLEQYEEAIVACSDVLCTSDVQTWRCIGCKAKRLLVESVRRSNTRLERRDQFTESLLSLYLFGSTDEEAGDLFQQLLAGNEEDREYVLDPAYIPMTAYGRIVFSGIAEMEKNGFTAYLACEVGNPVCVKLKIDCYGTRSLPKAYDVIRLVMRTRGSHETITLEGSSPDAEGFVYLNGIASHPGDYCMQRVELVLLSHVILYVDSDAPLSPLRNVSFVSDTPSPSIPRDDGGSFEVILHVPIPGKGLRINFPETTYLPESTCVMTIDVLSDFTILTSEEAILSCHTNNTAFGRRAPMELGSICTIVFHSDDGVLPLKKPGSVGSTTLACNPNMLYKASVRGTEIIVEEGVDSITLKVPREHWEDWRKLIYAGTKLEVVVPLWPTFVRPKLIVTCIYRKGHVTSFSDCLSAVHFVEPFVIRNKLHQRRRRTYIESIIDVKIPCTLQQTVFRTSKGKLIKSTTELGFNNLVTGDTFRMFCDVPDNALTSPPVQIFLQLSYVSNASTTALVDVHKSSSVSVRPPIKSHVWMNIQTPTTPSALHQMISLDVSLRHAPEYTPISNTWITLGVIVDPEQWLIVGHEIQRCLISIDRDSVASIKFHFLPLQVGPLPTPTVTAKGDDLSDANGYVDRIEFETVLSDGIITVQG
eukprot:PhF_6_TR13365/c0_g1_i1/m.21178